ncbi:MAG: sporulation transcriptional regulator SpoIIID [Gemmiger sp.]|nr:sporulation transcriptional regulator SpoIIID [Gemmiger sp.]
MKGDPAERSLEIGRYIAENGATVRAAARVFGVSKSTVWKDQARLCRLYPALWRQVQAVLQKNKAERHLRGGEATRKKYLQAAQKAPPRALRHSRPPGIMG